MRKGGFLDKYFESRHSSKDDSYVNFTGANAGSKYFNATGANTAATGQGSTPHPYIITVSNSSASTFTNFVLFNGNSLVYQSLAQYKISGFDNNGNYVTASGITVSSAISGVTYLQLVSQSITQPFNIATTVVTTAENGAAQLQQPITVTTTDASGVSQGKPVIFIKDPYQSQKYILVNNEPYSIDGTTTLAVNIQPNAVFNLYFYPSANINPASQLGGQDTTLTYAPASLIRVLPVAVANVNPIV